VTRRVPHKLYLVLRLFLDGPPKGVDLRTHGLVDFRAGLAAVESRDVGARPRTVLPRRTAVEASLPPAWISAGRAEVTPIEVGRRRQGTIAVIPDILADAISVDMPNTRTCYAALIRQVDLATVKATTMWMRVAAFYFAMAMSSAMGLAENPITTGSINSPNVQPVVTITVSGATGDGNASLKDAVAKELAEKGVGVTEKAALAYHVEGAVALGPAEEGKQSIDIEWTVRKSSGKRIGTISQRNEVSAGALDGEWGLTAKQAAGGAAQGIMWLIASP
jgi:hypothetical protein